jgi:hypothetical protein
MYLAVLLLSSSVVSLTSLFGNSIEHCGSAITEFKGSLFKDFLLAESRKEAQRTQRYSQRLSVFLCCFSVTNKFQT